MKIVDSFLKERGWLHNTGMLAFIYLVLVWGHSHYAQHTELWPSSMVASLINLGIGGQLALLSFFAFCVAWLVEVAEEAMAKGAKLSYWDIGWTVMGVPFAIIIYALYPDVWILFWIFATYVALLLFLVGRFIYKRVKTN